jgi:hypothetical protein
MTTATVPSRTSNQQYTVTLFDDGSTRCTCKAGQFGRQCWHQSALKAEALRRQSYELVSIRTGKRYGTYATLAEATAAQAAVSKAGGNAAVYRLS